MYILIGGAWPYANGSLHIGHIAGLIAGDVLARYHRQKGDRVCYVSGSDCHGTPITLRAQNEGIGARELSDRYHNEFVECFERLGFSYDMYGKTSGKEHMDFVKEFHKKLYESPSVTEKLVEQAYCEHCKRFLPDRFVNGICPDCGANARGDQCENCGGVFEGTQLKQPTCAECGREISLKPSRHLFLKLDDFKEQIRASINTRTWRKNAVDFTLRYINEGLRERALTRDLEWGIDVPKEGFEEKKIYIWAENILGYLSMCKAVCENNGGADHNGGGGDVNGMEGVGDAYGDGRFEDYYGSGTSSLHHQGIESRENLASLENREAFHYYVHGKDNIPFHSIILPALLLAHGGYHLPDSIISSEFVTLDGKKISTSANHAVWISDLLDKYNPDAIRYFFLSNAPEKRDADFTYREFANSNNGELLGVYGNFINRTLVFIEKYYGLKIPLGVMDEGFEQGLRSLFDSTGSCIESGCFKDAIGDIFRLLHRANKYFDTEQPWITRVSDPQKCANTLFNCVQIIANTSVLLEPFIPFSSRRIAEWLNSHVQSKWFTRAYRQIPAGTLISSPDILFERIFLN